MTYQRNETPEPLASGAADEFEAHLKAMPDWAPEFEVHRPWVEKLLLDTWNTATERAAKKEREECAKTCEDRATAYRSTRAPGWHEVDHECTQCAAAIRAREGKGGAG